MDKWEYNTVVLGANVENDISWNYINGIWPDSQFPLYAVEALIPYLNSFGQDGWELISCQPIGYAEDGKVTTDASSNTYFCVFKRRAIT